MVMTKNLLAILGVIGALLLSCGAAAIDGTVTDLQSGMPIADALVTAGQNVVRTDARGAFRIDAAGPRLAARAPGYGRAEQAITPGAVGPLEIRLVPFQPKALYLSFYGIGESLCAGPRSSSSTVLRSTHW